MSQDFQSKITKLLLESKKYNFVDLDRLGIHSEEDFYIDTKKLQFYSISVKNALTKKSIKTKSLFLYNLEEKLDSNLFDINIRFVSFT